MMGLSPLSALGARNLQALHPLDPVRPVTPVVRGSAGATPATSAADNKDKLTLRGDSPRAGDGLYTRKGTLTTSVQRQDSFDLTIQTAEGDTATLRFSQASGTSSAIRAQSAAGGSVVEALQQTYGALDVQINLQGSFNDEETRAMDVLLQQANRVADEFFAGDITAATAQADAMDLSGNALQSFSMDLRSLEMRRVSATYEETARYTAPPAAANTATPAASPNAPKVDLLQGLKQFIAELANGARNQDTVTDAIDKTALA